MKAVSKLHLALLSTVAFTVGLGWIYQYASGTLCYSKLGFIYLGNILFWLAAIKPIATVFSKQLEKRNLFMSLASVSLTTLSFNQLIIYFFVEGLFSLLYSCESNILLSELILTNGLLSNFVAFSAIIVGTNYEKLLTKFKSNDMGNHQTIYIKQNGAVHLIKAADIVKVEADNNAVNIYTIGKRYVQYGRLKDWEKQLQKHGLVRVHRSSLVNKDFIQAYQSKPSGDGMLTLLNGDKIKVSRNYRSNLYSRGQLLTH